MQEHTHRVGPLSTMQLTATLRHPLHCCWIMVLWLMRGQTAELHLFALLLKKMLLLQPNCCYKGVQILLLDALAHRKMASLFTIPTLALVGTLHFTTVPTTTPIKLQKSFFHIRWQRLRWKPQTLVVGFRSMSQLPEVAAMF